jgi:hypothetical protein
MGYLYPLFAFQPKLSTLVWQERPDSNPATTRYGLGLLEPHGVGVRTCHSGIRAGMSCGVKALLLHPSAARKLPPVQSGPAGGPRSFPALRRLLEQTPGMPYKWAWSQPISAD